MAKPALCDDVSELVARALLLLLDAALRLEEERRRRGGGRREGPAGLCGLVAEGTAELCALPRGGCEHPERVWAERASVSDERDEEKRGLARQRRLVRGWAFY